MKFTQKIGDELKIKEYNYDSTVGKGDVKIRKYVVIGIYPHILLLQNPKTGIRRAISHADLIMWAAKEKAKEEKYGAPKEHRAFHRFKGVCEK